MTGLCFRCATVLLAGFALLGASPDLKDKTLLFQQLHAIDQAEIQAGKLAEQRGQMQDVRGFGRMLVQDHTEVDRQLAELAKADGIPLKPAKESNALRMLNGDLEKAGDKLKHTSTANFDLTFARTMRDQHKDAINLVRAAEGRFSQSPEVERLLSNLLPQLQRHENMAVDIIGRGVAH